MELENAIVVGCGHDPEAMSLFTRHIHHCDRDIRAIFFMLSQHRAVVLLVDMVAREDEQRVRTSRSDEVSVLIERIGRTAIPILIVAATIRLPETDAAPRPVKVPRPPGANVIVER